MKKAFTLIELLVVIAIIAILAAILFPVFAQAKEAAKKTQDLSNIKQQSLGIQMYAASDNDDTFPRAVYTSRVNLWGWQTPTTWREAVMPYIKNGEAIYRDGNTTQRFADGGLWDTPAKTGNRGAYNANNIVFKANCQWDNAAGAHRCDQNGDGTPSGRAPMPSVTMTAMDAPAQTATNWTLGINPDWRAAGDIAESGWWWHGGAQRPPVFTGATSGQKWDVDGRDWPTWAMPRYRYAGGMNVGYGDGHAKFVKKGAFNWCQQVFVRGQSTNWNDPWDWMFDPGQPCAAFAR